MARKTWTRLRDGLTIAAGIGGTAIAIAESGWWRFAGAVVVGVCFWAILPALRSAIGALRNFNRVSERVDELESALRAVPSVRIIRSNAELKTELKTLVAEARACLSMTGSRSYDRDYLKSIETKLASEPAVVHYRVLFGQPQHNVFKDHLRAIVKVRDPKARHDGAPTLCIARFDNYARESEKFIAANETRAIVILPSLKGVGVYDTALVLQDPQDVSGILRYVRELYSESGLKVQSKSDIQRLLS